MAFTFLDIELDLDFRPEAFYTLFFVPRSNFEPDAPGNLVTLIVFADYIVQRVSFGCTIPLFDPSIIVRGSLKAYSRL